MITEDYVSPEIAVLLKKKGFNEECDVAYSKINGEYLLNDVVDDYGYGSTNSYLECKNEMSAPTLQMACKWLREVYGLFISIGNDDLNYNWQIIDVKNRTDNLDPTYLTESHAGYETYEEAVEAALKYSLSEKLLYEL